MTDFRTDEHGEVTLDPSMPSDVQLTAASVRRWKACAEYAARITGQRVDHPETVNLARAFYELPNPLAEGELEEARRRGRKSNVPDQLHFEREHPRDREGEFAEKPDAPKIDIHIDPEPPMSPGTSMDDIRRLGLDKWPSPSEETLNVLGGFRQTTDRWYVTASPGDEEEDDHGHPPYSRERRPLHDQIIGLALAGLPTPSVDGRPGKPATGVAALLGIDHPITQKLAVGGRLSRDEKEVVRDAARAARGDAKPEAMFMAGGPASGKTTVLENNPELAPKHSVYIDPDKLKEGLTEYTELRALGDHYAASAVHQESGDLAERLAREAQDLELNSVHDGTGNGGPGEFIGHLERKRRAGYDVSVTYATCDTDSAVVRSVSRAEQTGRYVPVPRIRKLHALVSEAFNHEIQNQSWLKSLNVFDPHGHIGGLFNGKFYDIEPERMNDFRMKENEEYEPDA